tara:strand:- start:24794 stop:25048 length:255 start_codon:yes stop_codon:yes gene_type:complete
MPLITQSNWFYQVNAPTRVTLPDGTKQPFIHVDLYDNASVARNAFAPGISLSIRRLNDTSAIQHASVASGRVFHCAITAYSALK